MNRDVLSRLLKERTVLVLPNISGFQQTDSDLIKSFVEQGGVIVAFGPQIPMGRSYERDELFGVEEGSDTATHTQVTVRDQIGVRVKPGSRFALTRLQLPSWTTKKGRPVASFEDGSPAITINTYGQGTVVTILPDALTAAQQMPELVRDVLDYMLSLRGDSPVVDIVGTNENSDLAVAKTATGFRVAIINYNVGDMEVKFYPIRAPAKGDSEWKDLVTDKKIGTDQSLKMRIPGNGFSAIEFRVISVTK
jgi:hypothetical protein